jgi:M6 family metalloprotease-like protein
MRNFILLLSVLTLILFCNNILFGQTEDDFICGPLDTTLTGDPLNQTGSLFKPAENAPGQYFRALIVFAEFQGSDNWNVPHWAYGSLPDWANDFIDSSPSSNYRDLTFSDYWKQMSMGNFDFIGDVYPIVVPLPSESYYIGGNKNFSACNSDVIDYIASHGFNFSLYDNWGYNSTTHQFYFDEGVGDGYVDMIYIFYRFPTHAQHNSDWFGGIYGRFTAIAKLGDWDKIKGGKHIYGYFGQYGSGITVKDGWRGHIDLIGICAHEYGHYLFGSGHPSYGGVMGGGTYALSGWEREHLGYINYQDAYQDNFTITLGDFIQDGDILRILVPGVPDESKYFLIENHQKLSHYDQIMRGGSIGGGWDFTDNTGAGIYIWRITNGNSFPPTVEFLAADGNYDWATVGTIHNSILCGCDLPDIERTQVDRNNGLSDRQIQEPWGSGTQGKWYDVSVSTHQLELTRNTMGDETDPYNIGYNEIISPWSSPNTYVNGTTNIACRIFSQNNTDITLKVYLTYNSALALPPSKPQFVKVDVSPNYHPLVSWATCIEPDVSSYNIYRSTDPYSSYQLIANVNNDPGINRQSYEDTDIDLPGPGEACKSIIYYYYEVQAVDNTSLTSLNSDPWYIPACGPGGGITKQAVTDNEEKLTKYSLIQNYPNPFNPTTIIKYQIPQDNFVSLKVYNTLGQVVANLVNANKQAGTYEVNFDGSKLSGGVYFYILRVGREGSEYIKAEKMLLLK